MSTPRLEIHPGWSHLLEYPEVSPRAPKRGTVMIAKQKWQIRTIAVLENVFEERLRQVAKYGHNETLEDGTGPDVEWLPVRGAITASAEMIEEDFRYEYEMYEEKHGAPTWMHLVREEIAEAFCETDPDRLEEELTQVAALAVSWIEKIRARREAAA